MNYIEACKALVDGKKVREKSWGKGDYIYFKNDILYASDGYEIDIKISDKREMDADSWEIYQTEEEKLIRNGKRWELYITCANTTCVGCRHNLNKCCQKIGNDTLANMLTDNTVSDDEVDKLYKALKGEKD